MMKTLHRISRHRGLVLGVLIVGIFGGLALAAPLLAPANDPDTPYMLPGAGYDLQPHPPSRDHPLGTPNGRLGLVRRSATGVYRYAGDPQRRGVDAGLCPDGLRLDAVCSSGLRERLDRV